ncbi:hypothetical protein KFK09_025298 [Dendrobium nobile]|uniref:Uncharacterized protein n=1 Tax=Dendrobium nobile TaxID=94219 RepID=A0A8T3AFZ2_DENNO|nr:hypothetical protein KFK09_025298 [Dendrobium nobile]
MLNISYQLLASMIEINPTFKCVVLSHFYLFFTTLKLNCGKFRMPLKGDVLAHPCIFLIKNGLAHDMALPKNALAPIKFKFRLIKLVLMCLATSHDIIISINLSSPS